MANLIINWTSKLNRMWLIKGTSYSINCLKKKLAIMNIGFFEYQNNMEYLLFTETASLTEILLASFFFIGFFSCCRVFIFIIWKLLAYKYMSLLKEYVRISRVEIESPIKALPKQVEKTLNLFEHTLLPWRIVIDLFTEGIVRSLKFNNWRFNAVSNITAMFNVKTFSKRWANASKKIMPEDLHSNGTPREVLDLNFLEKGIIPFSKSANTSVVTSLFELEPETDRYSLTFQKTIHSLWTVAKEQKNEQTITLCETLSTKANSSLSYKDIANHPRLGWSKPIFDKHQGFYDIQVAQDFYTRPLLEQEKFLNSIPMNLKHASVNRENRRAIIDGLTVMEKTQNEAMIGTIVRAGQDIQKTDTILILVPEKNMHLTTAYRLTKNRLSLLEIKTIAEKNGGQTPRMHFVDTMIYARTPTIKKNILQENLIVDDLIQLKITPLQKLLLTDPVFNKHIASLNADGNFYKINFCLDIVASDSFISKVQTRLNERVYSDCPKLLSNTNIQFNVSKVPDKDAVYIDAADFLTNFFDNLPT